VKSASLGHDALGEVNLSVQHGRETFRGRGVSTDTVESTVHAILAAVNRIAVMQGGGAGVKPTQIGAVEPAAVQ
jgi:2-isopropylmalate synthase